MRAPSLLRRPLVLALGLCLVGVAFLVLEPHFTKWRDRRERVEYWTPPDPATSGIPVDAMQALQALEAYGDSLPECVLRQKVERVEAHSGGEDGEEDHVHLPVPPERLPRLEGHTEEILPYLGHPSEPVVYHAARLLCLIRDAESKRAMAGLRHRYACRRWIPGIMHVMGMGRMPLECPYETPQGGYELLTTPPSDASKLSPEALSLAQRISNGEATAVRQALHTTQAMALDRRADGVLALMNVSTPQGLALVYQAILEGWEEKLLSVRTDWMHPRITRDDKSLLKGVGGAALRSVAERTGSSQESVLVVAVGLMPAALVTPFYEAVREDTPLFYAMGRFARSTAGQEVTAATARELLERINRETVGKDPQESEAGSQRLTNDSP